MFWTKSPGTGGRVTREEDFIVEEIPLKKFFVKFSRSAAGIEPVSGPYSLVLLKKKGMTTKQAVSFIAKRFDIQEKDIGYAGLKDKFAVTSQYLTIKGAAKEIRADSIEVTFVGFTDKFMAVGELEGNRFAITLRNCKEPGNARQVIGEIERRGMPNYFGPQRFGARADNHMIGRFLLRCDFAEALRLINSQSKRKFKSLADVDKRKLKFCIHAYQSYLFNLLLDAYVRKSSKPFYGTFPIVGFGTKLSGFRAIRKLMENVRTKDFSVRELGLKVVGTSRPAFVRPKNLSCEIRGKSVMLGFELPKGSYATVLIREMTKSLSQ